MRAIRECKRCGKEFQPYKTTDKVCSPKCAKKLKEEKEKEKRKIKREKKAVSIKALTIKADLIFWKYIRARDSACVTCGSTENAQCGHFVSRSYKAVRWDEKNAHKQCYACNVCNHGRQWEHGQYIDQKYWEGTADSLFKKANSPFKLTSDFLLEVIKEYEEKNKYL